MAKFEGSNYSMGFEHGKLFKDEIKNSFNNHCRFDISNEELDDIIKEIETPLGQAFPELIEELSGISDGSNIDYKDIVILNYWEEINAMTGKKPAGLCTSIGFKNTPIGPIIGKTTDIEIEQRNEYMLQWIYPDKGNKIIHLGKVGTLKGEVGMNDKGLCIGTSSTMPKDITGSQVERMTLVRQALQYCNNINDTIKFFTDYRFYILGLNILVMDLSGDAVVIEKGVANTEVIRTRDNYIFATNIFLNEKMRLDFDESVWYYNNAMMRHNNLVKIFEKSDIKQDIEYMKKILRNHDEIGGICNHSKNLDTFFASIIVPEKQIMYLADGRPCETEFIKHSIDKPIVNQ